MKKTFTTTLFLFLSIIAAHQASAQSIVYTQNFDASQILPTGWYATPNSWYVDTTLGNISSGYPGASGLNNIVIKDTTAAPGSDSLISAPFSTVGFSYITLDWGARNSKHFADSGSTINLYWSSNGTTWNRISYAENANNSNWGLDNDSMPVYLPAAAAGQPSLQLMWVADIHFTPSGTYRIDDINVVSATTDGIDAVNADNGFAKTYMGNNSAIIIDLKQALTETTHVELYDLSGRMLIKTQMNAQTMSIDGRGFSAGVYFVKVYDSNNTLTTKVLVK